MEQPHIFLFESAALNFFYRSIFFVTLNHQNCLMSAFENAWKSFERICAKRFLPFDEFFCWKLFDEKFLKTILKTYIVLRGILLVFGSSRKSVQAKDLFELKKGNAQNWEDFFLESKIRYRTRDRPGGLRFSIISFILIPNGTEIRGKYLTTRFSTSHGVKRLSHHGFIANLHTRRNSI